MTVNTINYKCNGCKNKGTYMCTSAKICTNNSLYTPRKK